MAAPHDLDRLEAEDRVVFRYLEGNPNGSLRDIAGVSQRERPRRRADAPPGARGRGADRAVHRRVGFLHLACSRRWWRHRASPTPSTARRAVTAADPTRRSPGPSWASRTTSTCASGEILGRRPTTAELAMYSVMWSEHCSYKSSKVHLRSFGELPRSEALLVGIGENAGVVDVGDGYAVTFKVESHNHPSYVEPYQGAATGVGGIVRDILTMGARPVACHGLACASARPMPPTPPACCPASSPGSAATATAWACPTSAASCSSTPATPATRWSTRCASASCGTRTCSWPRPRASATRSSCSAPGPGATASAASRCSPRETFDGAEGEPAAKRPSVQVGDPFTEKLLIEACLEIFRRRPRHRHPGPRRRRAVLRHERAVQRG